MSLLVKRIWNIKLWIALGLIFVLLNSRSHSDPQSPFWFSELILYALLIVGLNKNTSQRIRKRLTISRRLAPVAYVGLVWLFGMLYEMSLSVTGEGIGGMHPQTLPSFIIAQGDYIPLAIVSYFCIRKFHLNFDGAFFLAGGKSLTEGLIFTGVLTGVLFSPLFFLAPLLVAYYTLAYSSFIALPLLFIDEKLLWDSSERTTSPAVYSLWLLGFGLAFLVRVFWGLVYSPIVIRIFDLPPNLTP